MESPSQADRSIDVVNIKSASLIKFVHINGRFMVRIKKKSGQFRVIENCRGSEFVKVVLMEGGWASISFATWNHYEFLHY